MRLGQVTSAVAGTLRSMSEQPKPSDQVVGVGTATESNTGKAGR